MAGTKHKPTRTVRRISPGYSSGHEESRVTANPTHTKMTEDMRPGMERLSRKHTTNITGGTKARCKSLLIRAKPEATGTDTAITHAVLKTKATDPRMASPVDWHWPLTRIPKTTPKLGAIRVVCHVTSHIASVATRHSSPGRAA